MTATVQRDELRRLIDADDDYGLMMASVRRWMERHQPCEYAVVVAHVRDGVPDLQVPVIPHSAEPLLVPA